jgi:hypothetical protein
VTIVGSLACIYRYGPSRRDDRWRWVTWGSILGALLWMVTSMLFSWYVATFDTSNKMYGSLGAGVVITGPMIPSPTPESRSPIKCHCEMTILDKPRLLNSVHEKETRPTSQKRTNRGALAARTPACAPHSRLTTALP